ncbi:MFS transporter [Ensifer canadensis]
MPIFLARDESPVIDEKPDRHFMRYIFLVPTATAAVFIFGAVELGGLSLFTVYGTRSGFTESQAALLLTVMGIGNFIFQFSLGMLSDQIKDKRTLLTAMTVIGLVGALCLPMLVESWFLMAVVLCCSGGAASLASTRSASAISARACKGSDLLAANAAFVFSYAVGTVAGPQVIGASMDVAGNNGFAWAIAGFFGLYVALSVVRIVLNPKRS